MLQAAIPTKFNIPFANNAGPSFTRPIPEASQISIQAGAASLYDGFPPVTFQPVGAGGVPPFGEDMNGLMNQITAWNRWQQAGAAVPYDSAFSTAIGGYPIGAKLSTASSDGYIHFNTVDGNTTDPTAGGAGWIKISILAVSTGDVKWRPTSETVPGWLAANALTIGNAASGATGLASADTADLFAWTWNNFSNTQCPVSGGRGANAAADFAANKTITMIDLRGTGIIGMDTMGGGATTRLTGVPAVSGNATTAGSVLGENLHSLVSAENGPHIHATTDPGHTHNYLQQTQNAVGATNQTLVVYASVPNAVTATSSSTTGITINSSGSGTAHNTVQRSMVGTFYVKL